MKKTLILGALLVLLAQATAHHGFWRNHHRRNFKNQQKNDLENTWVCQNSGTGEQVVIKSPHHELHHKIPQKQSAFGGGPNGPNWPGHHNNGPTDNKFPNNYGNPYNYGGNQEGSPNVGNNSPEYPEITPDTQSRPNHGDTNVWNSKPSVTASPPNHGGVGKIDMRNGFQDFN